MKNTVKKILALVFVVAMVCSLAVPAFAAKEEYVKATVVFATKVNAKDGSPVDIADVTVDNVKIEKATVESVLKAADEKCGDVTLTFKNGQLAKVNSDDGEGKLGTGAWVVALNGKIVSEDLGTVAVAEDDVITVYLNEATFGTKLAQYDDSAIAQGIISFYYYDAEGNKQPLVDATVVLNVPNLQVVAGVQETTVVGETNAFGLSNKYTFANTYTTDENGQVWIAPQHLAAEAPITIVSVDIEPVKTLEDIDDTDYDADEFAYYNANVWRNLEARAIEGNAIVIDDLYDVAGATGDMTVVYVLVAFVAVATIAAVVVMKKKSVKAN